MAIRRVENGFYERLREKERAAVYPSGESDAYWAVMDEVASLRNKAPWKELLEEIFYGDTHLAQVKKLVGDGKIIKQMEKEGIVFLNQSAYGGDKDVVDFMLSMGADPNLAQNPDIKFGIWGTTPLISSIEKDNVAVFKKLLMAGAEAVVPTDSGYGDATLLEVAKDCEAEEIIKVLKDEKLMAFLTDKKTRALTKSFNELSGKVISNKDLNALLRQAGYADVPMFEPAFAQQKPIKHSYDVITGLRPSSSSPATYIALELVNEIQEAALKEKTARAAVKAVRTALAAHTGDLYVRLNDVEEAVIQTYGNDKKLISAFLKAAKACPDRRDAIATQPIYNRGLDSDLLSVALKIGDKFFPQP